MYIKKKKSCLGRYKSVVGEPGAGINLEIKKLNIYLLSIGKP